MSRRPEPTPTSPVPPPDDQRKKGTAMATDMSKAALRAAIQALTVYATNVENPGHEDVNQETIDALVPWIANNMTIGEWFMEACAFVDEILGSVSAPKFDETETMLEGYKRWTDDERKAVGLKLFSDDL